MKKALIGLIGAMTLTTATGCSLVEEKPSQTIENFYEEISDKEYKKARSYFNQEQLKNLNDRERQEFEELLVKLAVTLNNQEELDLSIKEETINGDTAKVKYSLYIKETNNTKNITDTLNKKEGEWKIDLY